MKFIFPVQGPFFMVISLYAAVILVARWLSDATRPNSWKGRDSFPYFMLYPYISTALSVPSADIEKAAPYFKFPNRIAIDIRRNIPDAIMRINLSGSFFEAFSPTKITGTFASIIPTVVPATTDMKD
jgi:hypothetical protein